MRGAGRRFHAGGAETMKRVGKHPLFGLVRSVPLSAALHAFLLINLCVLPPDFLQENGMRRTRLKHHTTCF